MNRNRIIALFLVTIFIFVLGLTVLSSINESKANKPNQMLEAYKLIVNKYYEKENLDKERLIRAAIEAMVNQLNDPYSEFFTEEEYVDFQDRLRGKFVGIGVELTKIGQLF